MEPTENELKTKPYRYRIAYLLDDLPIGAKYNPSFLHITILPWFALETDEGPFLTWFYKNFDKLSAFTATVGEKKLFGLNRDEPVSLMEPQPKFMELHTLALDWFGEVGASWAKRDPYVGNDYLPHVAQRQGFVLTQGQQLLINSVILIKAARRENNIRQVAAKAILYEL